MGSLSINRSCGRKGRPLQEISAISTATGRYLTQGDMFPDEMVVDLNVFFTPM